MANGEKEITALLEKLLKYEKRLFAKEEEMRKLHEVKLQGKCLVIPIILVILVYCYDDFISISDVSWSALYALFCSSLVSSFLSNSKAPTSTDWTSASPVSIRPPYPQEFSSGEKKDQTTDASEPLLDEVPHRTMSVRRRVAARSTSH